MVYFSVRIFEMRAPPKAWNCSHFFITQSLVLPLRDNTVTPEEDENRFYHERRLDGNG
jgi:hypothetical protein